MRDFRREVERRVGGARLRASRGDVVEELTQHVEDRYAELRAGGMSEDAAREAALAELDDEDVLERRLQQSGRSDPAAPPAAGMPVRSVLAGVSADARHAVRVLARAPAFTIIAALLIALGIGANTAFFTVLNAVLLRPLQGVTDASALVAVYTSDFSGPRYGANSVPDVAAMRESGAFAGIAAYTPRPFTIMNDGSAVMVLGEVVSADFFGVLGVRPALGRFFTAAENGPPGSAPVAVISHALWQDRLGGVPDVIGRELRVNHQRVTVIGVAPPSFRGMLPAVRSDMWVTFGAPTALADDNLDARGNRGSFAVGRLPEGGTLEAVQARLDVVAAQLFAEYRDWWIDVNDRPRVLTAVAFGDARVPPQMRSAVVGFFALLMTVVALVLLIACTNVANLMLSRAAARQEELGIRLALGATRGRIAAQLLVESVTLAVLGGLLGVLLAYGALRGFATMSMPIGVPARLDADMDARVLIFATLVTLGTGILFGLAPALQAGRSPAPLLKGGAAGRPRMRLRNALVIVQVAASMLLLATGGLFLRTLLVANRVDTGIAADNMLLLPMQLGMQGIAPEEAARLYDALQTRLAAVPGVQSVTLARNVPLGPGRMRRFIVVEGYSPQQGEEMEFMVNGVSGGYFEAMGIRVLRGRGFTAADDATAPPVMVVNEAFARRFWPNGDALGRRVSMNGREGPFAEIVGIVPDAKYRSLTDPPTPHYYYPYAQFPSLDMTVQVRTAIAPQHVLGDVRAALREVAPGVAPPQITTLRQHIGYATLPQRIAALVLAVLGGLALLIAGVGLYGLIAYLVAQRTREIGIRSALGASARDVELLVVRQGMRLAAVGIPVGLLLALLLARALRSMLLVSPADPIALAGVTLVLGATAALASWLPARRAARIDPLLAVRGE